MNRRFPYLSIIQLSFHPTFFLFFTSICLRSSSLRSSFHGSLLFAFPFFVGPPQSLITRIATPNLFRLESIHWLASPPSAIGSAAFAMPQWLDGFH